MKGRQLINVNEKALFSSDPSIRWEEAKKWAQSQGWTKRRNAQLRGNIIGNNLADVMERDIDLLTDLPLGLGAQVTAWGEEFALCGSLNAWMVFVGPSPGGSPSSSRRMHTLLDSSEHVRNPVLGRPHPSLWYVDGAGFLDEIRQWINGAYQAAGYFRKTKDEFASLSNFLILNLVKKAYPRERDIPLQDRRSGAERFWRVVMPVARPKLVIALTRGEPKAETEDSDRGVFRLLVSAARSEGLRVSELEKTKFVSGMKVYWLPKASIHSADWGHVLVATVPTHPSYSQDWIDRGRIQGRSDVVAYLASSVKEALHLQQA